MQSNSYEQGRLNLPFVGHCTFAKAPVCLDWESIDGFDPSIAPGTGTPSHGGFQYYEVLEIIQALAKRSHGNIIGMDLVEVAPAYDPTGTTSILAAQLLMNSIGFIFHARSLAKRR